MKPKIFRKVPLYTTKFLELVEISYINKNGKKATWLSAERINGRNAVVIAAIVGHGGAEPKLVVTKEFRVPIGGYEFGCPAGLIDGKEDPVTTARRELKEETGLTVKKVLRKPSPLIYNSAGLTGEAVHMVYVEAQGDISQAGNEESEDITTYLMTRDEIRKLMDAAATEDSDVKLGAKAYIIFERFVEHGDI